MAKYISDKTSLDERRHATVDGDSVVVNMAIATSFASIYRDCEEEASQFNIETPSYTWFLFQFWPAHRTTSNMLQYTGKFKVKRMVQARLFRKNNPDAHYCNAIYNFIKQRAMKDRLNATFFSSDAKCKISVGEPDFPLASVSIGKKVIVGVNESFQVGDHDYSKMSIIPDACLVHEIPESSEEPLDYEVTTQENSKRNSWFSGQVFYGFKSMVTQGSTAMRGVAEMGKILKENGATVSRFYAITDGGGDRRVDYLSVRKAIISLFLQHDLDEVLVCCTAAGLSYRNPVERVHAIANQGLQSVGMMRKRMIPDMEKLIKNCNSNEEIHKTIAPHDGLELAIEENLKAPTDLLERVFSKLSLKNKKFKIYEPASADELSGYELSDPFDEDISHLQKKENIKKIPKFHEFLNTHTTRLFSRVQMLLFRLYVSSTTQGRRN